MGLLRPEEIRRLVKYLREQIEDTDKLAQIEDELSGEFGDELIREPEILAYFPQVSDEFVIGATRWNLRVIPHAHLRMIQRGMRLSDLSRLFQRFLERYRTIHEVVSPGAYIILGRPKARMPKITLRVDVDSVTDELGQSHAVTMYLGRGDSEGMTLIDLD